MSTYETQKSIYLWLKQHPSPPVTINPASADLTEDEARALEKTDIRWLYAIGVQPVLLHAYARARGVTRDEYKPLLAEFRDDGKEVPRWRS